MLLFMLFNALKPLQNNIYLEESLVSFSCSFKCHNPPLVLNMQQTDSRNEFLTPENMEMDTNFIQIDQVFHEIMHFLPLGGSSLLPKQKNVNCSGPNHSILSTFLTDAE